MFSSTPALSLPELKPTIVSEPLLVSLETTVISAIAQMSGVRSWCQASSTSDSQLEEIRQSARSSCVLVMDGEQVAGILTERDIVRLSAQQYPLDRTTVQQVMAHPVITLRESAFTDLFFALNLLQQHRIRHLPIVDEQDRLVGLVTHETLRQISQPIALLRLRSVSEMMTRQVIYAQPDCSMLAIAQQMAEHKVSSVVIVELRETATEPFRIPVGIVTERDLVQFQALGLPLEACLAASVMSAPVFAVKPEDSLWSVHQVMEQRLIRRLVVTGDQGELLGIVTQTSLLQALNPLELYKLTAALGEKVTNLEAEKLALLESRAVDLEQQVVARTVALQLKAEREKLVTQIANRIRNSLDLQEILNACVVEVRAFLQCDRVLVYQFQPDWSGTVIAESVGDGWIASLGNDINDSCFQQQVSSLYTNEQPIVVNNIHTSGYTDCHIQLLERYQVKANLVMPIWVSGQLWGLLIGHQCEDYRTWQDEDMGLLQDIAVQLAIALQQATTYQQLQLELEARKAAEAHLRESEQRYAKLVEAAPVGIFRTDATGKCVYVNDRYCQITGLSLEIALGRGWEQGLHPDDRARVVAEWYVAVQENRTFQLEYRFQHADGSVRWVYSQSVAEQDVNGQVSAYVGTITDISDRKRSEEALQRSEAHQRALMRALPDLIMRVNREGIYLECITAPHFPLVGLQNLIGSHVLDVLPAPLSHQRMDYIQQALQTREMQIYEQDLSAISADGNLHIEEVRVVPYSDDEVLLLVRDVSERKRGEAERKQAELALKQSEAKSRAILAAIPDLMFRVGADGIYRGYVTQHRSYDVVPQEVDPTGQRLEDLLPPNLAVQHLYYVHRALETGELQVFEQQLQVGDRLQEEEVRVVKSDDDEVLFMVRDITDRKRAEAALKQSELTNRIIIETLPDLLIQMDREGNYNRFVGGSGVRVQQPIEPQVYSVLPRDLAEQRLYYANQALDSRQLQMYEQIFEIDGEQRHEEVRIAPLTDQEVLIIVRDITDRKQAEAERLQAEKTRLELKLLEQILDIVLAGYWDWDIPNHYEYLSPGFKQMFGYEDQELPNVPESWQKLIFPEDLPSIFDCFNRHVESHGAIPFYNEVRYRHKDGSTVWVLCSGQVIEWDEAGNPLRMIGCHIDITKLKVTEASLRQTTEELDRFFSVSLDLLCIADVRGHFRRLNLQWEKTLGYPLAELEGSRFLDYIHPDDLESTLQAVSTLEDGQQLLNFVNRYRCRDGSYRWVEWRSFPKDDLIYAAARDITEQRQAEFAIKQQLAAIEAAIDGIAVLQGDTYLYLNKAHLEMFGYQHPEELLGQSWENLYSAAELERFQREVFPVLGRDRSWQGEAIATRKDGSTFDEGLSLTLTEEGLLICVCRDITEKMRLEAERKQAQIQLQQTNEELARATRLKDEFLANMSHELRTPLNAILGMTEGLQEEVFGLVNDEQSRALQTIERSGSHLLELINDILDVAKIESGQIELECTSTAVTTLCQSSLAFIKQQALKKRIQVEVKLPLNLPNLLVDERRIRQVLINLLNNAVKFTPDGGRITLEVSRRIQPDVAEPPPLQGITRVRVHQNQLEQQLGIAPQIPPLSHLNGLEVKDYLRIAVTDTGIGIAPEHLSKLFQPFVQIDSALNRQYAGTGLGLALVKRIVELHRGQVGVTSRVGLGSCFTIDLPCDPAPVPSLPQSQTQSTLETTAGPLKQANAPLILLAEDNEANVSTVSSYLKAKGYRILLAKNGQEAIDLARSEHPNLILMDIQMPGMDGLEAIQQLRHDPNLPQIPIIALTALAMSHDRDRCLAAGADDYISKPIKLKQLVNTIQQHLTPSSSRQERE